MIRDDHRVRWLQQQARVAASSSAYTNYYGQRYRDYIAIGDVLCIATASCTPTLRVDVSQMKRRRQGPRRTVNATAVRRARNS